MGPKKKPATKRANVADDVEQNDAGQRRSSRQGFKDASLLSTALSPHINKRFFTSYTSDRSMKYLDKKKLGTR